MKLPVSHRQQGSVLLLTMFTCVAIGIVLASFLTLISARNKLTIRSTGWNTAIPVLEAGIEEALTHLHKDKENLTANGWSPEPIAGQQVYTKIRTLPDGSYYNVKIFSPAGRTPMIYSQGFVPSPLEKGQYISRLVRVGATNPPAMFITGVATTGKITLTGNAVVDGYDSTLGPYNTSSNRFAGGGMATCSTAPDAVNIGGAHVYGNVITGPGGGVIVGSGGAVGDVTWNTTQTGIQPGWTNNDMNVSFPSNAPPTGGPYSPPGDLTLDAGTYQMSSFSSTTEKKALIVTGHATLWVTGDFTVSGTGYVQIQPGASLTLYVGGTTKVAGGGIVNEAQDTSSFTYIGLSSNKAASFSGTSDFYGTINAPQADVKISGGGQVYGAIIGSTFTSVGGGSFHYDRSLARTAGLIVTSWKEL